MKRLVAALASAALLSAPMIAAAPASAQTVVTTTVHTYHYSYHRGYGRRRAYVYRGGYHRRACCETDMAAEAARTGLAVDTDFQAPIGEPVYANGDVAIICGCQHHQ